MTGALSEACRVAPTALVRVANGQRIAAGPRREIGQRSQIRRLAHSDRLEVECYHEHIDRHVEAARDRGHIGRRQRASRIDAVGDDDQRAALLPVRTSLWRSRRLASHSDVAPYALVESQAPSVVENVFENGRTSWSVVSKAYSATSSMPGLRPDPKNVRGLARSRHLGRHAAADVHENRDACGAWLRPHITQRPFLAVVVELEVAALEILDQAAARIADLRRHSDLLDALLKTATAGSCADGAVPAANAARRVSDRKSRRINTLSVIGRFHCTSQGRYVPALAWGQ